MACGVDWGPLSSESEDDTPPPGGISTGSKDRVRNDAVSVDEGGLRGQVVDGKMALSVPLASLGKAAKGTLAVHLRSVDGAKTLSTADLPYDVPAGGKATAVTTLALPPLAAQADAVAWIVSVEDGTQTGLHVRRSLSEVLGAYDLLVDGPNAASPGKKVPYRLRARDPRNNTPIAGAPVRVRAKAKGGEITEGTGVTGETGDLVLELAPTGESPFAITAEMDLQGTQAMATGALSLKTAGSRVMLSTDKPLYQPGQTIHLRSLALGDDQKPIAGAPVTLEVSDGKGNKVMKRTAKSDVWGIASADFVLGTVVNAGTYKLVSTVGTTKTERAVTVGRYVLPKFKLGVGVTKPWYRPGEVVTGTIDAAYFFGKAVADADVVVEAGTFDVGQTLFQKVQTKTDAAGKATFSVTLPQSLVGLPLEDGNAIVTLRAKVTDGAGQVVTVDRAFPVSSFGARVVVVPESTGLVPGLENHFDVYATDPLGAPLAGTPVEVAFAGGGSQSATTDASGWAGMAWTPTDATGGSVTVTVKPVGQAAASMPFSFGMQDGSSHLVVRTDKALYDVGEPVTVTVATTQPTEEVYVDWTHDGQVLDMRTLKAEGGKASFVVPVDASLVGASRIEAYVVDAKGMVARAGRTVFARKKGALTVDLVTDKAEYKPGEEAKLTFHVKDEEGQPAAAALGVQIVDEAVFALSEATPGLFKTYFELEDAYAKPSYEIAPPPGGLGDLLYAKPGDADQMAAAQKKAAATFAAMGSSTPTSFSASTWPSTLALGQATLAPFVSTARAELVKSLSVAATSASLELMAEGCTPTAGYCKNQPWHQAVLARAVGKFAAFDFWGNAWKLQASWALVLSSQGPDEVAGTVDDVTLNITPGELGIQQGWTGSGSSGAAGGWGGGAAGSGGSGSAPPPSAGGGEEEPRVRRDFPETLYVNPALITGGDGSASITVPMADSITTWRVSSLAHTAGGRLGGGLSGVKVFQDFFVDLSLPATLTRGDEVTFPVAVYNYLDVEQTVTVTLQPTEGVTLLGGADVQVTLPPGAVKGVSVPVRVEKVGVVTLGAKAIGSKKSDAVARSVLVLPDGKEKATTSSGGLAAGTATVPVEYPADATPGSGHLHVEIYPTALSEVVNGMESLLRTPNGCFEQTTSSTWPNVLVSRYVKATGQGTPEISLKAESLISAGYQRLLTFEHPGGGFSWFGTQDGHPYLSVTAFGVMEFADMAEVATVDPQMLTRTTSWLAAQQAADGSWKGDQTEFFSFQTSTVRNTAFVAWALASAKAAPAAVASGLAYVKAHLDPKDDAYTLGIAANAFAVAAPNDPFTTTLLTRLEDTKVEKDGKVSWPAAGTQTDFYGQGQDADVTITALAAHALMKGGGSPATAKAALAFLAASRDAQGNFGSTQATIWSLRALLLAAEKGAGDPATGEVTVRVDGAPFTTVTLSADAADVLSTVDLSSLATTGHHEVTLDFAGVGKLSYAVVAKHNVPWAGADASPAPLSIGVAYDKTSLAVNDTVKATVTLTNTTGKTLSMAMVTLGIPPGFEVDGEGLDALKKKGVLSSWQVTAKQLDLYVPVVGPSAPLVLGYTLRATMPVKAEDGGATAYPYYQPTEKAHAASVKLEVVQ